MSDVAELLAEIRDLQAALDECHDPSKAIRLERMLRAREAELADLRRRGR